MASLPGGRLRQELESIALATLDLCLAFVGIVLVIAPGAVVVHDVLGTHLSTETFRWLVGSISFAGTYPFVTGQWSLGALGESAFRLYASVFGLAVLASIPFFLSGGVPSDSILLAGAQVGVLLGGYAIAVFGYHWSDHDR